MANKRTPPTPSLPTISPLDSRGVNSPFVDRDSRDADLIRIINSKGSKEQGSDLNLRGDGGSRNREKEARSPKGDRELSEPASLPANPFTASSNILQDIAARFNAARELSKASAWRQIQTDLMNASPFICPGLIPYKDLLSAVAEIEKEIKGTSSSQTGKSNEELLASFLSGGPDLGFIPPPPSPKEIDNSGIVENGDGAPPS